MTRESRWHKVATKIVQSLDSANLVGSKILEDLKEAGFKISPKRLGKLMGKLGFTQKRIERGGVRTRKYRKPEKPLFKLTTETIGFKCYNPGCPIEGGSNCYYKLRAGEKVDERDKRMIVSELNPEGRLAICPKCYPKGKPLRVGWAQYYVYFYKHGYTRKDGEVAFEDEYEHVRTHRGGMLSEESGYSGSDGVTSGQDDKYRW